MRRGVALIGVVSIAVALAAPAAEAGTELYWPIPKLMRILDGARVSVPGGAVRLDAETTLCAGRGTPRRVRGARAWRSFACTYTLFTRKGVDRDLDFRVEIRDARRFRVTDAHWVGETR
jgi:hypothetical protein